MQPGSCVKIIPQCGFESAASDLLVLELVNTVREHYGSGTRDVVASVHDLRSAAARGVP